MTLSHTTVLFAVRTAKIRRLVADPSPTRLAILGVTNAGTTVTAQVATTASLSVGQAVIITGITGFTTNNPNGTFVIGSIVDATHFTYVVAVAPTGVYASGGSVDAINPATYGPPVELDAMKALQTTPSFKTDTIRGGMQVRSSRSVPTDLKATLTFAGKNVDAQAVMFGGMVVDSGADPQQSVDYTQYGDDRLSPFMIEAQCTEVDTPNGDAHVVLYRCTVDAETDGLPDEAHQVFSVGVIVMPRLSDKKVRTIRYNQQLTAIA